MKNPVLDLLRETLRRNRKNEVFKMVITLGVITVLGIGVAAAAISIGPEEMENPAMRPLSTQPGLAVAPAFGDDDEDCITATRRQVLPNGRLRVTRELICEQ
jgi:hypothetical protein